MKAIELLEEGKKYATFFTGGDNLTVESEENLNSTGRWSISADMKVDKVLIYLRKEGDIVATIYEGNYKGKARGVLDRRFTVYFTDIKELGTTANNWSEFTGNKSVNPVAYFG